jgi:hypothetical protein
VEEQLLNRHNHIHVLKRAVWPQHNKVLVAAYLPHAILLADADRLLPEDQLSCHIEIEILLKDVDTADVAANWPLATVAQCSTENLRASMLDDFVDIPSTVQLVFADGQQRCHTFPLVAR